jgi:hypothetical protein
MFDDLTDDNFVLFAAKHYNRPHCHSLDEFNEDLRRVLYIKKMLVRYKETKAINIRLILNHLIVLFNMFDHEAIVRVLFLKLDEYLHYIRPFLEFIGYWTEKIEQINGTLVDPNEVYSDNNISKLLREI